MYTMYTHTATTASAAAKSLNISYEFASYKSIIQIIIICSVQMDGNVTRGERR